MGPGTADGSFEGQQRDAAADYRVRPSPGQVRQPFGVVSRRDEQQRRGVGADPVEGEQPGGACCDEGDDELIEALQLAVEEFSTPSQLPQRYADGIADDVAGPGP